MSIESLKEKARGHEQNEDWSKALDLYLKAIERLDEEDGEDQDIGLFNRVGDLEVRIGKLDAAVSHYERAVDLYVETGLPNNAIAICKKVIRNLPGRDSIYLKMGQIRAEQGFLTDARQSFLTYAERKQAAGDLEEAFRGLYEFVELVPEDFEVRLALASQLSQHERVEEAVEQLVEARRLLILDDRDDEAGAVADQIAELEPDAELADADSIRAAGPDAEEAPVSEDAWGRITTDYGLGGAAAAAAAEEETDPDDEDVEFEDISIGGDEEEGEEAGEVEEAEEAFEPALAGGGDEVGEESGEDEGGDLGSFSLDSSDEYEGEGDEWGAEDEWDEEDEEGAAPLPMMEFGSEEEGEDGDVDDSAQAIEEAIEDQVFEAREEEEGLEEVTEAEAVDEEAAGLRDPEDLKAEAEELLEEGDVDGAWPLLEEAHQALADRDEIAAAAEIVRSMLAERAEEVALHQRLVEYGHRLFDDEMLLEAYLGLAACLRDSGDDQRAQAVYQQALDVDPSNEEASAALEELSGKTTEAPSRPEVASSEEYVDLGAMILDEEGEEKTTRFVVAADAPSGDEAADFAKMLTQFKEKVAENLDTDDVAAHYDLGTAYKEMGLVDEAISEFQAALRANREHLPTYEMLGQCFLEKGESDAAARTLKKALDAEVAIEDELLGIYYFLGRANEEMGNDEEAVEFYDKVFSLDINFMDVTERLRTLR